MKKTILILPFVLSLTACDFLGLDLSGEVEQAQKVKNSNAIGAGCKQAGKSLEECYTSNPKAIKSAVFDGWKTMDEYMRENNMQIQVAKEDVPSDAQAEAHKNKDVAEEKPPKH